MPGPKILFPPGFGDSYWCLTKMESFIERNKLDRPRVYTWESNTGAYVRGKPRTVGFLERYPFIQYMGGWLDQPHFDKRKVWEKFWAAPMCPQNEKPMWIQKAYGFGCIILLNGVLENGLTLDSPLDGLNKYHTNWYPLEAPSQEEIDAETVYRDKYGRYLVAHFSGTGHYGQYYYDMVGFPQIAKLLIDVKNRASIDHILVVGVDWDASSANGICMYDKTGSLVNLVNQTTAPQLMGLIKGSIGGIGTHSGCTMMPVIQKKPTIMFYTNRFPLWNPSFIKNCLPPESLENWYFPRYIELFGQEEGNILNLAERIWKPT